MADIWAEIRAIGVESEFMADHAADVVVHCGVKVVAYLFPSQSEGIETHIVYLFFRKTMSN